MTPGEGGDPDWRKYEKQIARHMRDLAGGDASVEFDVKLPGLQSGTLRQVDVLVTGSFAGRVGERLTAAVECKHYKRNVDVKVVEAFLGFVDDVGTDLGFVFTSSGYSDAARKRIARHRGIRLREVAWTDEVVATVDVISTDEIGEYALPYSPASDEKYYASDSYDHEPYGTSGTTIYVWESEDESEVLEADVSWEEAADKRECAVVVLRHWLGREPKSDEVDLFVTELAATWEDGHYWVVWAGELIQLGLGW